MNSQSFGDGGFELDRARGRAIDQEWAGSLALSAKPERRRTRMFAAGELRLCLLHLIGEEPRHGYDLIQAIKAMIGGDYAPSPGVIYPTLSLMVDEGVIKAAPCQGTRKSFELVQEGAAELAVRRHELAELLAKFEALRKTHLHVAAPELARSMGNLSAVLSHRVRSAKISKTAMQKIVDMVDNAARKIERL